MIERLKKILFNESGEEPPSKETLEEKLARKKREQKDTEFAAKIGNPFFDVDRGIPKKKKADTVLPSFKEPGEDLEVAKAAAGDEEGWDKKIAAVKDKIEEKEWEEKEWEAKIDTAKRRGSEGVKKSRE